MGTWGTGNFENDQAMDWVGDIIDGESLKPIDDALGFINGNPVGFFQRPFCGSAKHVYIDADIASQAIVAAEFVAAILNRPCESLPEGVAEWIEARKAMPINTAATMVVSILDQILEKSELSELWAESDEFDQWKSQVNNLKERLS